eukprot:gene14711-19774_t
MKKYFANHNVKISYQALWNRLKIYSSERSLVLYLFDEIHLDIDIDSSFSTKLAIQTIISDSWKKVVQLISSPEVLKLCENELKATTSLLVLAAIKKAADEYPSSQSALSTLLFEADVNRDGQLSFTEWFNWFGNEVVLPSTPSTSQNQMNQVNKNNEDNNSNSYDENYFPTDASFGNILDVGINDPSSIKVRQIENMDPMIASLGTVLGHAVCTLKIVARMTNDPAILSAGFIAGGISSGLLDERVCKSMLVRLKPDVRKLVLQALSAEASTLSNTILSKAMNVTNNNNNNNNKRKLFDSKTSSIGSSFLFPKRPFVGINNNNNNFQGNRTQNIYDDNLESKNNNEIIMTVDLKSIPLVKAPPIIENENTNFDGIRMDLVTQNQTIITTDSLRNFNFNNHNNDSFYHQNMSRADISVVSSSDLLTTPIEGFQLQQLTVAGTINQIEAIFTFQHNKTVFLCNESNQKRNNNDTIPSDPSESSDINTMMIAPPISNSLVSTNTSTTSSSIPTDGSSENNPLIDMMSYLSLGNDNKTKAILELNELSSNTSFVMNEIVQLRSSLYDLYDGGVDSLRKLIATNSNYNRDVIGLALAMRSVRLQLSSKRLPNYARQQLAIDSIQLWAPLSYQLGLSNYIPELEIHSFIQLFPRSFGTFVIWYDSFKPFARHLLKLFKLDLENKLRSNKNIAYLCDRVLIQSRLKTPSSAFKKAVKGGKIRNELLDLIGVRIIVTENAGIMDEKTYNNSNNMMYCSDSELEAVLTVYGLLSELNDWKEDISRFKDYINNPKKSGYQSIHSSLLHVQSGIQIEVQVRSQRMHFIAEYGSAAHNNYKALLLPSQTSGMSSPNNSKNNNKNSSYNKLASG